MTIEKIFDNQKKKFQLKNNFLTIEKNPSNFNHQKNYFNCQKKTTQISTVEKIILTIEKKQLKFQSLKKLF